MTNPTGDALKASAAQVRVKPLEWAPYAVEMFFAPSIVGDFVIGKAGHWWLRGEITQKADSVEEAKAAAQADYEARILSALSPVEQAPQPVGEPVAYSFRLARSISHPGCGQPPVYLDFDDEPRLSFTKPCVPDGSIKDLKALYAAVQSEGGNDE